MKISIVGSGNAGCLTALHYSLYTKNSDTEIELIHTDSIPAEPVGQGTLQEPPELFWSALGFNWWNNPIHATFKSGILYEGWGNVNENVFHSFPASQMAMHYSPSDMQKYVLSSGLFKVKEDDVKDLNEVDSDYVFDCRGKPESFEDYDDLLSPVNSVILGKPNWNMSEQYWTRSVATPDGWCFVIPAKKESKAHDNCVGYLYNNKITTKEEAEKNFLNQFDVSISKHLSFRNYVAKNPIIDNRIILSGNKFFFLEPLESTAVQAYLKWARYTFATIVSKERTFEDITKDFKKYVTETQNFILWHYNFGSKYDSKFWNYAKKLSFNDEKFNHILEYTKGKDSINVLSENFGGVTRPVTYSHFLPYSIKNWFDGMTKTHSN